MPTSPQDSTQAHRWVRLEKQVRSDFPHLSSWFQDIESFLELRIKARDDGTVLAIAKGFSADGGRVVAFGVGLDVVQGLMALDSTLQGGHWKVDKPWKPTS